MTNKNFTRTQNNFTRTQKSYGATEKSYGATEKFYGVSEKYYGATEKFYGAIEKFYGVTEKFYGVSEKFYGATEKSNGAMGKSDWVSVKNVIDFSVMLNELKNYIKIFFFFQPKFPKKTANAHTTRHLTPFTQKSWVSVVSVKSFLRGSGRAHTRARKQHPHPTALQLSPKGEGQPRLCQPSPPPHQKKTPSASSQKKNNRLFGGLKIFSYLCT